MKTVYLVQGRTGCYEDRYIWIAKSFFSEKKAKDLCEELNKVARKSLAKNLSKEYQTEEEVEEELIKLDPKAKIDFPGTSYNVENIEVED